MVFFTKKEMANKKRKFNRFLKQGTLLKQKFVRAKTKEEKRKIVRQIRKLQTKVKKTFTITNRRLK